MKTRRDKIPRERLREQYAALRQQVLASPVGDLLLSDVRAPVRHIATLRFIARQNGLVTLRQLVDRAAEVGAVPFDVEPGVTLARAVEHLLHQRRDFSLLPATNRLSDTDGQISVSGSSDADQRDSVDDLIDAAEELRVRMLFQGTSQWVMDALHEYVTRMQQPLEPIPGTTSSAPAFRLAIDSVRRLKASLLGGTSALRGDLGDSMSALGERDGRIAQRLLGVGEEEPLTLEEVGAREGVTRERIRQLYKRFRSRAIAWSPPALSLVLLQRAIDRAGRFVTAYELHAHLPKGVLTGPPDLRVVDGLLELRWLNGLLPSRTGGVWLREQADTETLDEKTKTLRQRANRHLRRWGAVEMTECEDLVGDDGPGFIYHLILQGRPFQMVGAWSVLQAPHNSVLADRVQRLAEVTPAVPLGRFKRALRKSLRALPPDEVLMVCLRRDVPDVDVDDDTVTFGQRPTDKLSRSEALARRIVLEEGGATTLRTLQRQFVRAGMSGASAGIVYSRSPILERIAYGVIGIVGSSVNPNVVHERRKQVKREASRSLVGYRRLPGAVELSYKLDPLLVSTTLFLVPRNLIEPGAWSLSDAAGHVVVRPTYVSGLHQAAKACVSRGARRMTVVFHLGPRTVQVTPL